MQLLESIARARRKVVAKVIQMQSVIPLDDAHVQFLAEAVPSTIFSHKVASRKSVRIVASPVTADEALGAARKRTKLAREMSLRAIDQHDRTSSVHRPGKVLGEGVKSFSTVMPTPPEIAASDTVQQHKQQQGSQRAPQVTVVRPAVPLNIAAQLGASVREPEIAGSRWLVSPTSAFKGRWDIVLALCIIFSVLVVPLRIGFGIEAGPGTAGFVIDIMVDLLFFGDMVINFRTVIVLENGTCETSSKAIATKYLKGWFVLDFMSTFPFDHVGAAVAAAGDGGGGDNSSLRSLKVIRVLRLLRLVKILRLAKLARIVTMLEDDYDLSPAAVRMFKLGFQMTFVAHCLSCFWYYHHVSAGKKHDCSTLDARVKDWSSSWV